VSRTRWSAAALALCAIAVAGCGIGPGKDEGEVDLTVTRDYGTQVMLQKTDSIHESDSVIRLLDRNADITTRYGGGFIQSIDGLAGSQSGGRTSDWFFYVNGIESPIGSAEYDPSGGDRVWWDYRDWTAAMRVPAVVGSWPEPFVNGFQGERYSTVLSCGQRSASACDLTRSRLEEQGIEARVPVDEDPDAAPPITVLVGTWAELRQLGPADVRQVQPGKVLSRQPSDSGVFARFVGTERPLLQLENQRGEDAGSIGKGGGLVAALRDGDEPPVWVVTGTDQKGVAAAAELIGPALRNHYAVATQPGAGPIGVPVP
jgi:hypothetical protein